MKEDWLWLFIPLIFIVLIVGLVVYDNCYDFDAIPVSTQIHCKTVEKVDGLLAISSGTYYYAISEEGERYRLTMEDWSLLDVPNCESEGTKQ